MALAGEEGEELDVAGIELCAKVFDHYVFVWPQFVHYVF